MTTARRTSPGISAAIAIIATGLLGFGCASQGEVDNSTAPQKYCRDGKVLRCFKRTAGTEECTCVAVGRIEDLIEDSYGNH